MAILEKQIRTCVVCRNKFPQNRLFRLMCKDKKLVPFDNNGRSFYICDDCMAVVENAQNDQKDYKKLERALFTQCRNKDDYIGQLKEILTHVR